MLSNLASYIFGGATSEEEAVERPPVPALSPVASEDEWVVVGGDQPSLTLGSLNEANPRPVTGSTGSSEAASEVEDDMVVVSHPEDEDEEKPQQQQLTRSGRRLTTPFGCANSVTLPQMKALRSAQKARQKEAGKAMTNKASQRQNMAVKCKSQQQHSSKRNKAAANLAIRASGCKQLKQC